jgi:hypothetical protein
MPAFIGATTNEMVPNPLPSSFDYATKESSGYSPLSAPPAKLMCPSPTATARLHPGARCHFQEGKEPSKALFTRGEDAFLTPATPVFYSVKKLPSSSSA